jgi:hypothetical protein
LKKEVSKIPDLEKKHSALELENRRMMTRIQQLEQQMMNGLRTNNSPDISSPASFPHQHRHNNSWSQSTLASLGETTGQYQGLLSSSLSSPLLRSETLAQNEMLLSSEQPVLGSLTNSDLYNQRMTSNINGSGQSTSINGMSVKQEKYGESPTQSSSGIGSLTSPSPATLATQSGIYSHVVLDDHHDPIFASLIKDEVLSPQAMDICN